MTDPYVDDSDLSEITILPDGRVYIFGLSERLKALLETLQADAHPHPHAPATYKEAASTGETQLAHTL